MEIQFAGHELTQAWQAVHSNVSGFGFIGMPSVYSSACVKKLRLSFFHWEILSLTGV